jgi:hypothetical protein
MRPLPGRADADSHLWPCPQCGSANGLNARACWNCDATLEVPAEDELPAPISAALTAQGMRIPEIPLHDAGAASDDVATLERPTASARRRSLFEAAIARMNGEPDDPSDRWEEYSEAWPAPVEPMRTEVDATFAEWSDDESRRARLTAAGRSGGQGSGDDGSADDASAGEPAAEAPSMADPSTAVSGTFEPWAGLPTGGELPDAWTPGPSRAADELRATELDEPGSRPAEPRGRDDSSLADATALDAPVVDALDAPALDAPALDAPALDASAVDASAVDASAVDASAAEASAVDASAADDFRVDASPAHASTGESTPSPSAAIAEAAALGVAALPEAESASGASPHADAPNVDMSRPHGPPSDTPPHAEPKAPSFADKPFDATRFAVKSFDPWRAPDEVPASESAALDAPAPLPSHSDADPVEPHVADPVAAVAAVSDAPAFDRDAQRGDSSAPAERDDSVPSPDLAAALTPIDESLPPRWPSKSRHPDGDALPWPQAIVVESDPPASATSIEAAATSAAASTPPFVFTSDPPFLVPNDPPPTGTPSTGDAAERANDLPPIGADAPFVAPPRDPATAKRRARKGRSREESAIQTFEDSFLTAGSHPPIHSDDDASFDNSRAALASTHPPVRGGRDPDAFGPLPSARAERTSDALHDESLGERFAALASTSAQAARRRRRVTIAALCAVLVAVVLGVYPFFGNGVRVDLSSDELRSAASMSTSPLAPAAVAPTPDARPAPAGARSAGRTEQPAPATTPAPAPATATTSATPTARPTAPAAVSPAPPVPAPTARSDERAAPPAQGPTPQTAQATSPGENRAARPPREVAERLARRQADTTRTPAGAAATSTAERNRIDADRARAEAARSRPPVERAAATADDAAPVDTRANRRRAAADDTAADSGGSITCTERILALNLCGPSTRKE